MDDVARTGDKGRFRRGFRVKAAGHAAPRGGAPVAVPIAMTHARASLAFAAAAVAAVLATAPAAHAQSAPPPRVLYTAPLYQQTQGTYVPQSVAMSGPRELRDWKEGDAVPDGYHAVERTRKGLVVGGAVTFGTLYFFSALAAAVSADANPGQSNPLWPMWIPGIGPFIQMTQGSSATGNMFLALDGVAQTAGLAMLFVGLTSPKTVLVRNDLSADAKPTVRAMPIVGRNMTGVGVVGTF
jgi:hypothetical protein